MEQKLAEQGWGEFPQRFPNLSPKERAKLIPIIARHAWSVGRLVDYIHLNPVRAGLVHDRDGLEAYGWSSLAAYIGWPGKRPQWLETTMGFSVADCRDNATGRREFLGLLEQRVDWRKPSRAGLSFAESDGNPDPAIHSTLRRGWFFGSQSFREKLLRMIARTIASGGKRREDGYRDPRSKTIASSALGQSSQRAVRSSR